MENIEYIFSLAGAALSLLAAFLTVVVKLMKVVKEWREVADREKIVAKLPDLIAEAETFLEYSGEEKKAYVLDKISRFAVETGIQTDLEFVSGKIEELVKLSKEVNKRG